MFATVILKEDAKIPHDVTAEVGMLPTIRSWACPVFALKRKNVTVLANEDEMPDFGPLHPLPVGMIRWMGPNPAVHSSVPQDPPVGADVDDEQIVEGAQIQNADQLVAGGQLVDVDATSQAANPVAEAAQAVVVPPSEVASQAAFGQSNIAQSVDDGIHVAAKVLLALGNPVSFAGGFADVAALTVANAASGSKVTFFAKSQYNPFIHPLSSFTNLSVFEVNLDTMVPSYISSDSVLLFLAFISLEQDDRVDSTLVGPLLPPLGFLWSPMKIVMMKRWWKYFAPLHLPPGSVGLTG
jgi:hypothetical protein